MKSLGRFLRSPGDSLANQRSSHHSPHDAAGAEPSSPSNMPQTTSRGARELIPSSFSSMNSSSVAQSRPYEQSASLPVVRKPHDENNPSRTGRWRLEHSCASAGLTLVLIQFLMIYFVPHWSKEQLSFGHAGEHLFFDWRQRRTQSSKHPRCAINFWGLPRAFESLVLPSIEKNIISVNAKYGCDYYMHFFIVEEEVAGRSGQGGHIDPLQVYKLRPRVKYIHRSQGPLNAISNRKPVVEFASTTDQEFLENYRELLDKIRDTVNADGKHVYYPDNAKTYTFPSTTDNIIRMWHTIQESWRLMELHERKQNIVYDRVAMLRNDVLYATPIDIYEINARTHTMDVHNHVCVVPGFGRHPVSDRLVYGPRRAVQVWAAQRFPRLEQHVRWIEQNDPGWGLHSERFVNYTLFSAMKEQEGVSIVEHDTLCFFRARSDSSVWVSDCDGAPSVTLPSVRENLQQVAASKKELVETILERSCGELTKRRKPYAEVLPCPTSAPKRPTLELNPS